MVKDPVCGMTVNPPGHFAYLFIRRFALLSRMQQVHNPIKMSNYGNHS